MEIHIEAERMPSVLKQQLEDWIWNQIESEVNAAVLEFIDLRDLPVVLRRIAGELKRSSMGTETVKTLRFKRRKKK